MYMLGIEYIICSMASGVYQQYQPFTPRWQPLALPSPQAAILEAMLYILHKVEI